MLAFWGCDEEKSSEDITPSSAIIGCWEVEINDQWIFFKVDNTYESIDDIGNSYRCNGSFDYTKHKAVWPSTGNYCRGGVAISKILGFKSVAILPEGMSKERFNWLEKWVEDKNDIIKTTGTESNVKEIYDACNELEKDKNNDIINQFDEYYNYATHRAITGSSFEKSFLKVKGVQCIITNSRHCSFGYDQRVELFGSKGMLISGNKKENETEIFNKNKTSQKKPLLNFFIDRYVDAYKLQLDELARYTIKKNKPISSFEDGRRALIIANAASSSLKQKKQIKIKF